MKRRRPARAARCCGGGYTYLGLMFIVTMLALTATAAALVWHTLERRERERELVFAGQQYRLAIEQFHLRAGKDGQRSFPRQLEDLLRDPRALTVVRDLRRLYPDPITGQPSWGLVRNTEGAIVGVYSPSNKLPLWRAGFPAGLGFERARSYRDWRFIAPSGVALGVQEPVALGAPLPAAATGPTASLEPAAELEEPLPPPSQPRARQDDYRTRSPEACQRIANTDQAICAEQTLLFGATAGLECSDSATERAAVCPFVKDGPLPTLFFRTQ